MPKKQIEETEISILKKNLLSPYEVSLELPFEEEEKTFHQIGTGPNCL